VGISVTIAARISPGLQGDVQHAERELHGTSATAIQATVPAGAPTGPLSVTSPWHGTSSAFNVVAGAAAKLVFQCTADECGSGSSDHACRGRSRMLRQPRHYGHQCGGHRIGKNPSSGTLAGTLTASAANGIATFSNCASTMPGRAYTLTAAQRADGSYQQYVHVVAGAAAKLVFMYSRRMWQREQRSRAGDDRGCLRQPRHYGHQCGGHRIGTNPSSGTAGRHAYCECGERHARSRT